MNFNRVFHYKPSILGYPYFWKHPYLRFPLRHEDNLPFASSTSLAAPSPHQTHQLMWRDFQFFIGFRWGFSYKVGGSETSWGKGSLPPVFTSRFFLHPRWLFGISEASTVLLSGIPVFIPFLSCIISFQFISVHFISFMSNAYSFPKWIKAIWEFSS